MTEQSAQSVRVRRAVFFDELDPRPGLDAVANLLRSGFAPEASLPVSRDASLLFFLREQSTDDERCAYITEPETAVADAQHIAELLRDGWCHVDSAIIPNKAALLFFTRPRRPGNGGAS